MIISLQDTGSVLVILKRKYHSVLGSNEIGKQWRIQGGAYGSWPLPWGPGGTTGLAGAPRACQGHPRLVRGTTGLSGAPQACQDPGAPQACQSPGAPQACQGPGAPAA